MRDTMAGETKVAIRREAKAREVKQAPEVNAEECQVRWMSW